MSRQKLGQHFLHNSAWRARIAEMLPAARDVSWLEIGPGHGEMTEILAQRANRLIAIETDAALAQQLRERASQWVNVEIVEADVLTVDLHALTQQRFRVYGNLPYYITSPILRHLFACADQIESIHVVVQWEVAQRIVARPHTRDYGYLSALCQYYARPEIALRIPPGAFSPPPKVFSALLAMPLPGHRASLHIADDAAFLNFLQQCYAQKRKTLRNNLKATDSDEALGKVFGAAGLSAHSRAEELTLAQFADLFARLREPKAR
ncbi:MAG TPA: 16S rRNA (adenine(1518)-N(6)/adenine(1519)-N(6))-dimethyltransferase RsmA [Candidatus Acidoferrales bacterium]|nr:16S rRNA (adenine(1518)-N(6)/adenine(1519)-N(6))-dimethyltransferase RsmA [Candidatus Acidoferrales bacterium]